MVRYFYAWLPVVAIFGTFSLVLSPILGLVILMVGLLVVVAALVALAWAGATALYALGRAVPRRVREHNHASQRLALNPSGVAGERTR